MAAWGWLRHAPWGELVKAAARVPEIVRDLRRGTDEGDDPVVVRPPQPGDAPPDVAQLKFELELAKSRLDKLTALADAQQRHIEAHARTVAESFNTVSARQRQLTWLTVAALVAAVAALAVALLR